jgi:hypothetical protein
MMRKPYPISLIRNRRLKNYVVLLRIPINLAKIFFLRHIFLNLSAENPKYQDASGFHGPRGLTDAPQWDNLGVKFLQSGHYP